MKPRAHAKANAKKAMQRPELKHETDRLRRMNAPLATHWYVVAGDLARRLSLDVGGVFEMWAEMAHTYTYDGTPRVDAEQRAWRDTVEILEALASKALHAA